MNLKYEVEFKSDIGTSQKIINEVLQKLDGYLDGDDIFDLRLILNELVSNSIIHGNKRDPRKRVRLRLMMMENVLDLTVSDEGEGVRLKDQKIPDSKSINGRGLLLVKGLTDTFEIIGNSVRVTRKIQ
ncbi:MAG: ATP-binding protein [Eubacteriales bacterium]|nr:ATP-binding protein [Eubacteriales bacterium]